MQTTQYVNIYKHFAFSTRVFGATKNLYAFLTFKLIWLVLGISKPLMVESLPTLRVSKFMKNRMCQASEVIRL